MVFRVNNGKKFGIILGGIKWGYYTFQVGFIRVLEQ